MVISNWADRKDTTFKFTPTCKDDSNSPLHGTTRRLPFLCFFCRFGWLVTSSTSFASPLSFSRSSPPETTVDWTFCKCVSLYIDTSSVCFHLVLLASFYWEWRLKSALCESRRRSSNGDAEGAYRGDKEDEVLDRRRAESADGGSSPGGEESLCWALR